MQPQKDCPFYKKSYGNSYPTVFYYPTYYRMHPVEQSLTAFVPLHHHTGTTKPTRKLTPSGYFPGRITSHWPEQANSHHPKSRFYCPIGHEPFLYPGEDRKHPKHHHAAGLPHGSSRQQRQLQPKHFH